MPPFRIHQTRNRPERILIRLTQGKYVFASQLSTLPSLNPVSVPVAQVDEEKEKPKNVISLKQIKQIIGLLQQTSHKDLSKMLSPELSSLLSIQDEDVDKVEEEESDKELDLDDDEELLIIDV
jgi:hypothetical protein